MGFSYVHSFCVKSADPSALCRRGRRKGPRSIALVAQSSVTEPALCLARAWFVHPWHFVYIQSMWGLPWFCFHLAGSKMLCGTCLRTNLATPWACILMGVWPFRQVAHECHHSGDVLGCVFFGRWPTTASCNGVSFPSYSFFSSPSIRPPTIPEMCLDVFLRVSKVPFRQVAHECHHSGDVLGCVFTGFEGALSAPVCGRIWPPLGLLS